jgi:hypothetical protein
MVCGQARGLQVMLVDLRIMQANDAFGPQRRMAMTALVGAALLAALALWRPVDQPASGFFRTTGRADEAVFAVDDHGWHASDFIFLGQLARLDDLPLIANESRWRGTCPCPRLVARKSAMSFLSVSFLCSFWIALNTAA